MRVAYLCSTDVAGSATLLPINRKCVVRTTTRTNLDILTQSKHLVFFRRVSQNPGGSALIVRFVTYKHMS